MSNDINLEPIFKKIYLDNDRRVKLKKHTNSRYRPLTYSQVKEIALYPAKYLREHIKSKNKRDFLFYHFCKISFNHKIAERNEKINQLGLVKKGYRNRVEYRKALAEERFQEAERKRKSRIM